MDLDRRLRDRESSRDQFIPVAFRNTAEDFILARRDGTTAGSTFPASETLLWARGGGRSRVSVWREITP